MRGKTLAHLCLSVVPIILVHQTDDMARHIVEVEDRRVGVKACGMELVTVLHGKFSKSNKVPPVHCFNHLLHSAWDHRVSPMLSTEKEWVDNQDFFRSLCC